MQTFLPLPSFYESAKVLDYRRLGKQRVEAYQILRVLTGESKGWINHPAVKMWRGYEIALISYGMDICLEWIRRGYKDTLFGKLDAYYQDFRRADDVIPTPYWLDDNAFHASHRSNLLRKDSRHYSQFGWSEPDNLPYVWPMK